MRTGSATLTSVDNSLWCVLGREVSTAGPSHYRRGEGHSSNLNFPSESNIDMDEAGPRSKKVCF